MCHINLLDLIIASFKVEDDMAIIQKIKIEICLYELLKYWIF